jgi:hypothetical protein
MKNSEPQTERIYLDAFLEIINIQKILYYEILFIIENTIVFSPHLSNKIKNCKELWRNFAQNLQLSIKEHLYKMWKIAETTRHRRHYLLANVEMLELHASMLKLQLKFQPKVYDNALKTYTIKKCKDTKRGIVDVNNYCICNDIEKEFKDHIFKRLNDLQKKCDEIEICAEDLSKTLSYEERSEIHRAMQVEFMSSGAFDNLPNYSNLVLKKISFF